MSYHPRSALFLVFFCLVVGGRIAAQDKSPGTDKSGQNAPTNTDGRELVSRLLEHLRQIDAHADDLGTPDFPKGKEWFNSPALSFKRELRGKITVLDFWTYCCINCIHVLPDLEWLETKYSGYPVAFVGVHSAKFENEKAAENVREAVLRYEIRHPVINDDEMAMWKGIGVSSWPTMVLVGPKGNLLLRLPGEGNREIIDAAITAALRFYPPETFRHDPLPLRPEVSKESKSESLRYPGKLAVDPEGDRLFISDSNHNRIVVTDFDGKCLQVIGSGRIGLEDGGLSSASFHRLQGLAYSDGKLYVADAENHALRLVDLKKKTVTTLAGNGSQGRDYVGGGRGRAQQLSTPWDVLIEGQQLFVAMAGTHQIWEYDLERGIASVFSGTGRELNLNHPDRLQAAWAQPSGLTLGGGQLFVADSESSTIRAISLSNGASRGIVGGAEGQPRNLFAFGDRDGYGVVARLQHPLGVLWLPKEGRVVVADTYNHRLKLLDPRKKRIEAWVGAGKPGRRDGVGLEAEFAEPSGLALAPSGQRVFVADANNHAIRIVEIATRSVTTLRLKDVPPPPDGRPPRTASLADIPGASRVKLGRIRLAARDTGRLLLDLRPPSGWKYTEGSESRWQLRATGPEPLVVAERFAQGSLLPIGAQIVVPFTVAREPQVALVQLEALAYYCREDVACRVGAVIFEVEVEVVEDAAEEAVLRLGHTFSDASSALTQPGS